MREPAGPVKRKRPTMRTTTAATRAAVARKKKADSYSKPVGPVRENAVFPAGGRFAAALARTAYKATVEAVKAGEKKPVRVYPSKGKVPEKPYVNRGRFEQYIEEEILRKGGFITEAGRRAALGKPPLVKPKPTFRGKSPAVKRAKAQAVKRRAEGRPVRVKGSPTRQTAANTARANDAMMKRWSAQISKKK